MAASNAGPASPTRRVLAGFLFALAAGALWGTTGPLSTALYAEGAQLTAVGFWRVIVAVAGFALFGLTQRDFFRYERRALLLVGIVGGALVALFELAFQFAIAGVGVAGAVALLYTAPVLVAILAHPILGERLTSTRIIMAGIVMAGVYLAVNGGQGAGDVAAASRAAGITGGLLAALGYAGSTLLARFAVPRYGSMKVLFLELVGGAIILALVLPLIGHAPAPPASAAGWLYVAALGAGAVLAANFCFFAAARRIDAAPTAVAASIEPVVGALLALVLLGQQLTAAGWLGLALVVTGVAGGYAIEAAMARRAED